jgi:hypothetical protein
MWTLRYMAIALVIYTGIALIYIISLWPTSIVVNEEPSAARAEAKSGAIASLARE